MTMTATDPTDAAVDGPMKAGHRAAGVLLVAGIALACLVDAIATTVLSLARFDMLGDIHATSDEFVRLDVGYTAAKLVAFLLAPWMMGALTPQSTLRAGTAVVTLACGAAALTVDLNALFALRLVQGVAGGALLVSGQTVLFRCFDRSRQPVVQCIFAMGAVLAPATLAPYMQGFLLDSLSWTWIFLSAVPLGLIALALLASTAVDAHLTARRGGLDGPGLVLFAVAASCLCYALNQGARWDWFDAPRIAWLSLTGAAALIVFIVHQRRTTRPDPLLDLSVFRDSGFAFGFIASFAAGFALFGSAYLIPSFAVSVLSMTLTEAGGLLLPSTVMFAGSLVLSAFLVRRRGVPPVATVPLGILCFILAMWMLSGATGESGFADLAPALLVRGAALGFLFLSITLITLVDLKGAAIAYGVGLFNVGRQTGGLFGVAFLQTQLEHGAAANRTVLCAYISPGRVEVTERIAMLTASLSARGLEAGDAAKAAMQMLARDLARQASVNAFETAFLTVALFFVVAAPVMITVKLLIGRMHRARGR